MSMYYDTQIGFGGKLTKTIKYLIIIQTAIYLLQKLGLDNPIEHYLGLRANLCMNKGMIWQLLTYHLVPYGGFELFINAIILWMLGSEVEETLGTKYFIAYYFFSGIGAGCGWLVLSDPQTPLFGSSAILCSLLLAFAYFFTERIITLLILFIFPAQIKAKHLATVFIGIELILIAQRFFQNPTQYATLSKYAALYSALPKYVIFYTFFSLAFGYLFLKKRATAVRITDTLFAILNYFNIFKITPKHYPAPTKKNTSHMKNIHYTKYTEAINKLKAIRQFRKDQKIIKPNFKKHKNTSFKKGDNNMKVEDKKIDKEVYISKEIDPILDKISKEGIHSLSNEEKAKLDAAKHLIK